MNKFLKCLSKTIKIFNNSLSNYVKGYKNNLVILKEGDYFAFHATSKNVSRILNKKRHKQAREICTLCVDNATELKNYLCKSLSPMLIKDGSNLYNVSIYQIIQYIKQSNCSCYSIQKHNKQVGRFSFDAKGKILDTLELLEIENLLQ